MHAHAQQLIQVQQVWMSERTVTPLPDARGCMGGFSNQDLCSQTVVNVQMQHQQLLLDEEQKLKASAVQQQQQQQQEVCRRLCPSS